jgi:hypothetical protein
VFGVLSFFLFALLLVSVNSQSFSNITTNAPNSTLAPFLDTNLVFLLPHCPRDISKAAIQAPSTFIFYLFVALLGTILAAISFLFFNHIRLPHVDMKIRTTTISNSMWVLYFSGVGLRGVVNAVRFGKPATIEGDSVFIFVMTVTCMLIHGLTGFFLTLALNYQRRFRSGMLVPVATEITNNTVSKKRRIKKQDEINDEDGVHTPVEHDLYDEEDEYEDDYDNVDDNQVEQQGLINSNDKPKVSTARRVSYSIFNFIFAWEFISIFCLFLFFLATYLRASNLGGNAEAYKWFQFSVVILQRVPIVIIALQILFSKKSITASGGPTIPTRILLVLALLLNIPNDMSMTYWHMFLRSTSCVFYIASIYDFILLLYLISLVIWFLFMRAEYVRNQEDTMFTAVRHSQDRFDFRTY